MLFQFLTWCGSTWVRNTFTDKPLTYYLLLTTNTHIIFVFNNFPVPALMAFQVSSHSPLDIKLQNTAQTAIENGYVKFIENFALTLIHRLTKADQHYASSLDTSRSPSFTTCKTAQILPFYVCFNIGLAIALLVFLGELVYFKYERRCRMTLAARLWRLLAKYRWLLISREVWW